MPTYGELKEELAGIAKILEQYPEELRLKVYDLLVGQYLGDEAPGGARRAQGHDDAGEVKRERESRDTSSPKDPPKRKAAAPNKESYGIDRALDLRGGDKRPSFKDFVNEKKPSTVTEFNAVAVYYLTRVLDHDKATLNQVFTCYKEAGRRPPEAFRQSFNDAKTKKGWLDIGDDFTMTVPLRGETFVEHDLPVAPAKKSRGKD
jgi:hypothetical protein